VVEVLVGKPLKNAIAPALCASMPCVAAVPPADHGVGLVALGEHVQVLRVSSVVEGSYQVHVLFFDTAHRSFSSTPVTTKLTAEEPACFAMTRQGCRAQEHQLCDQPNIASRPWATSRLLLLSLADDPQSGGRRCAVPGGPERI
jgi:hypothetical protein